MGGVAGEERSIVGETGDLRYWWVPERLQRGSRSLEKHDKNWVVWRIRVQREIINTFLGQTPRMVEASRVWMALPAPQGVRWHSNSSQLT